MVNLGFDIAGLHFRNPVMTASGTCGFGPELEDFFDVGRLAKKRNSMAVDVVGIDSGNPFEIIPVRLTWHFASRTGSLFYFFGHLAFSSFVYVSADSKFHS